MTAPRHLWSGDWQDESSAHAEDLAARRATNQPQPEPEPEAEAPTEPAVPRPRERRPSKNRRALRERLAAMRAWPRGPLRVALLAAFLTLVVAGGAYAVISDSNQTKNPPAVAAGNATEPWLGVELANAPVRGALVAKVVPGSPAAKAGIRPGDLITQLDTQPIEAGATLVAAISGLQPGDTVDIQLQRGASQYTVDAQLAGRPVGTP
jgi:membrane-associated protease RseP (regulator of RpoE activity)